MSLVLPNVFFCLGEKTDDGYVSGITAHGALAKKKKFYLRVITLRGCQYVPSISGVKFMIGWIGHYDFCWVGNPIPIPLFNPCSFSNNVTHP